MRRRRQHRCPVLYVSLKLMTDTTQARLQGKLVQFYHEAQRQVEAICRSGSAPNSPT